MSTKINLYKQTGTDTDTKISFNVPRSLTYGLNARANDDGGVSEADNCEYNILNSLFGISYEPLPIQPETAAYLAATGITGATEVNAINTMVYNLKQYGLWSKMKAVYPFVTDNRNLLSFTESTNALNVNTAIISINNPSPTGSLNAVRFSRTTSNPYIFQSFAAEQNTNYTFSVYVRAVSGSANFGMYFNHSNGAVNLPVTYYTATETWQRFTITANSLTYPNNFYCVVNFFFQDIELWGWQLEKNTTATAYQPILGSQQAYISNQFKYNLVNPVDSDAAFRLVFNGGWTHSANGATPNGTNGYADTKLNPLGLLTKTSHHISFYSRTQNTANNIWNIGCEQSGTDNNSNLSVYFQAVGTKGFLSGGYPVNWTSSVSTNTLGLHIGNQTSSTSSKLYQSGVLLNTNTNNNTSVFANLNYYIGAVNNSAVGAASYSIHQAAFSSIGDGLTDTEAAYLYSITQQYQTFLNRAV